MQVHARAPLSPIGRRRVVDRVRGKTWSVTAAAEAAGVSERTIYRWLARVRDHGPQGLIDRPPIARHQPRKTPADRVSAICALRRLHMTAAEIAEVFSMPLSTVSAVLSREGLGKRSRLTPIEPPDRYERRAAGELVHIDIKSSDRSSFPVTPSPATAVNEPIAPASGHRQAARSERPAGSSSTSRSTTTRGLPTPKCCPTRSPPARSRSCTEHWRSSAATASPSSAS